jgi:predicted DNA-binding protein
MNSIISSLSLASLEKLLSFTSTYGVLFFCLGIAILGFSLMKSLKRPTLLLIYFCLTEVFIHLFFSDDTIHTNLFYLNVKILAALYLIYTVTQTEKMKGKFCKILGLTVATVFLSVMTVDNIIIKNLGNLPSEERTNQYGLDYQKRLIHNTAFYKIRLEVYNKENNYVKVLHSTDSYSIKEAIEMIETKKDFWNLTEKFLKIENVQ